MLSEGEHVAVPRRRLLLYGTGAAAAVAFPARARASSSRRRAMAAGTASGVAYVSKNGSDTNDGTSWAAAKLTVAAGLAALPSGGTLFVGAGTFTGSGLVVPGGGNLAVQGAGAGATILQTTGGDLWAVPPSSSYVSFEDLGMFSQAGGGHLYNAATSSLSFWSWRRCQLVQTNDAACIWYMTNGTFINCTVSECAQQHTRTASVPSWNLAGPGSISGNCWENIRHTYTGNYAVQIASTAPSAYSYGNTFRNITWEVCDGGFVKLLAHYGGKLENLISYDGRALSRDGYVFGYGGSGNNLACWGTQLDGLLRLNPQVLGPGVADIRCRALARGKISGCNGVIDLGGNDVLAESLLYLSSPATVVRNNRAATELSPLTGSLVRPPVRSVSAAYAASAGDSVILANTSGGSFAVTLPSASGVRGQQYTVKKTDSSAGTVTVVAPSGQLIDGAPTRQLTAQYAAVTVLSDGSGWQVL